ncbi:hypothetical protein ACIBJI_24320 [Nocardia sp. NPDC050408]|uniref:hypothetical protein n=1 Tax=Nocardia sp. NPDC050408 TaxID=3364319 RepID=UPI0037993778
MVQPENKRLKLFVRVVDRAPRVEVIATVDDGERSSVPALIHCHDLAAAQRISHDVKASGCEAQRSSPLLLVVYGTTDLDDDPGRVHVLERPRAVVSLLIDVQLLGMADGIVLVSSSDRAAALQDEIAQELAERGIDHYDDLPGYELVPDLDRSAIPRGTAVR